MLQRIGQIQPQTGYQREKRPDRVDKTGGSGSGAHQRHDSARFSGGSAYLLQVGWSLVEMKALSNDRLTVLFYGSDLYFRVVIETHLTPARFILSIEKKVTKTTPEKYVILPVRACTSWAQQGEHRISEEYRVLSLFADKVADFAEVSPGEKAIIHFLTDLFGNVQLELEALIQNIAAISLTFLKKMERLNERASAPVSPEVIWEDPLVEGLTQ